MQQVRQWTVVRYVLCLKWDICMACDMLDMSHKSVAAKLMPNWLKGASAAVVHGAR